MLFRAQRVVKGQHYGRNNLEGRSERSTSGVGHLHCWLLWGISDGVLLHGRSRAPLTAVMC